MNAFEVMGERLYDAMFLRLVEQGVSDPALTLDIFVREISR